MLKFIHNLNKREQIKDILTNPVASHNQRVYLAGFLMFCGKTEQEVIEIINKYCRWNDYNRSITEKQVTAFFTSKKQSSQFLKGENCLLGEKVIIPDTLDPLNKAFFQGAVNVAWEYENGKYNRTKMNWDAAKVPIFRSIIGKDHKLLVIDIDRQNDLDLAYSDAKTILASAETHFDFIKFSGAKGFHLIKKINEPVSFESLKNLALKYANGIEIDPCMFEKNRLVRGYCINNKTGWYSVACNPLNETLSEILDRSKTFYKK